MTAGLKAHIINERVKVEGLECFLRLKFSGTFFLIAISKVQKLIYRHEKLLAFQNTASYKGEYEFVI